MAELHDVTGNTSGEWGAHKTKADYWRQSYAECINIIRKAGYTTILVIDAPGWGQNLDPIVECGQELIDHDPQHNSLFSIHMYGS